MTFYVSTWETEIKFKLKQKQLDVIERKFINAYMQDLLLSYFDQRASY